MKSSRYKALIGICVLLGVLVSASASAGFLKDIRRSLPANVVDKALMTRPPETQPGPAPVPLVTAEERMQLIGAIGDFDDATKKSAKIYESILLALTVGSIILGLSASIAAFCKRTTVAGILSIIASGIVGIGSALPIAQSADFYRLLSAQSGALRSDAELTMNMTLADYTSYRKMFKALVLYEGEKFPSRTNTVQATETLLTEILMARNPA